MARAEEAAMIKFKDPDIQQEFLMLDARLKVVAYVIAGFFGHEFHKDLMITCVYRQNSGTHRDWRAFDGRTFNLSQEQGDRFIKFVNEHIDYGDGVHFIIKDERKPGSSHNWTAPHIHVQVPPRDEVKLKV